MEFLLKHKTDLRDIIEKNDISVISELFRSVTEYLSEHVL